VPRSRNSEALRVSDVINPNCGAKERRDVVCSGPVWRTSSSVFLWEEGRYPKVEPQPLQKEAISPLTAQIFAQTADFMIQPLYLKRLGWRSVPIDLGHSPKQHCSRYLPQKQTPKYTDLISYYPPTYVFLVVPFLLTSPPYAICSPHACYMTLPFHPLWLDHSDYI
jgi:hypothetical protein